MRSRIRASSSRLSRFGTNHGGYCISTAPSFSGPHQGSQRVDEARPHFVEGVGLEVVRVEVPLRRDVDREFVAEVAPQRGRAGRMPGEQRVRLDVHHEALRRAIDPRAGQLRGGREVVGAVDFDDREPAGIELQALLGGHRPSGIPVGLLGERLVGPRAGADEHASRSGHPGSMPGIGPEPARRERGGDGSPGDVRARRRRLRRHRAHARRMGPSAHERRGGARAAGALPRRRADPRAHGRQPVHRGPGPAPADRASAPRGARGGARGQEAPARAIAGRGRRRRARVGERAAAPRRRPLGRPRRPRQQRLHTDRRRAPGAAGGADQHARRRTRTCRASSTPSTCGARRGATARARATGRGSTRPSSRGNHNARPRSSPSPSTARTSWASTTRWRTSP